MVHRGLASYNTTRLRPGDDTTLDILVRDDNSDEILGGLLGHTSYGLFFLDLFYLPEGLRGAGLGSRIIILAEDEARRCGGAAAFVYTVTFQAPEFYERHGYRRFGEITATPVTRSNYLRGACLASLQYQISSRSLHSRHQTEEPEIGCAVPGGDG